MHANVICKFCIFLMRTCHVRKMQKLQIWYILYSGVNGIIKPVAVCSGLWCILIPVYFIVCSL